MLHLVIVDATEETQGRVSQALSDAGIEIYRSWLEDAPGVIKLSEDLSQSMSTNFQKVLDILQPRG